jgi:hypothetical protein
MLTSIGPRTNLFPVGASSERARKEVCDSYAAALSVRGLNLSDAELCSDGGTA